MLLAVLARDHTKVPIKLWAKKYISCLPIQAEAASILWAIVEGHLWKAQWKEKPKNEGRKKLTMRIVKKDH